jgi:hypothetical protein
MQQLLLTLLLVILLLLPYDCMHAAACNSPAGGKPRQRSRHAATPAQMLAEDWKLGSGVHQLQIFRRKAGQQPVRCGLLPTSPAPPAHSSKGNGRQE